MTIEASIEQNLAQNKGAHSLLGASMAFMDKLYDPDEQLLRVPAESSRDLSVRHNVRESIWYAFGLVLEARFTGGNPARLQLAQNITRRVLREQMLAPEQIWHGTFKRHPTEPVPPENPVIWKHYDPNWRQFIGTILVLMLELEGEGALRPLRPEIERSLTELKRGEPKDRVPPTYTNIALMKSWLELSLAQSEAEKQSALAYAKRVYEGYKKHGAFLEYNSPTYYGINFFALSLWADFSTDLADMGRQLTSRLWQDIGRYYNPHLHNLCGPWSRSYGMDMQQYAAAVGLWMWSHHGRQSSPVPQSDHFAHAHDFCLGPLAAACCTIIEEKFLVNPLPRRVSQTICTNPTRSAVASIDRDMMLGLESSEVSFHGNDQYHPLTAHWRSGTEVHWLRLRLKGRVTGDVNGTVADIELHPDPDTNECRFEFSTNVQPGDEPGEYRVGTMVLTIVSTATATIKHDTIVFTQTAGQPFAMTLSLNMSLNATHNGAAV